jgi:hypothetical protein
MPLTPAERAKRWREIDPDNARAAWREQKRRQGDRARRPWIYLMQEASELEAAPRTETTWNHAARVATAPAISPCTRTVSHHSPDPMRIGRP